MSVMRVEASDLGKIQDQTKGSWYNQWDGIAGWLSKPPLRLHQRTIVPGLLLPSTLHSNIDVAIISAIEVLAIHY